jgi:hypothetical protein
MQDGLDQELVAWSKDPMHIALELQNRNIKDAGASTVAELLGASSWLSLSLNQNGLTHSGANYIFGNLNSSLVSYLDMSGNDIGDQGCGHGHV